MINDTPDTDQSVMNMTPDPTSQPAAQPQDGTQAMQPPQAPAPATPVNQTQVAQVANVPAQMPAAQPAAPQPAPPHVSAFQKAFSVLSGGSQTPQRDPNTGEVLTDANGKVLTKQASSNSVLAFSRAHSHP